MSYDNLNQCTERELSSGITDTPDSVSGEEYSGHNKEGLNENASYDRMIFLDQQNVYNFVEINELISALYDHFESSDRSRLEIRILISSEITEADLSNLNQRFENFHPIEICTYPEADGNFQYLTAAFNIPERSINERSYSLISQKTKNRIQEILSPRQSFSEEAGSIIQRSGEMGFFPTLDIKTEELFNIWRPFGWDRRACEVALNSDNQDVIMGLRDRNGLLVGAALYSDQSHNWIRNGETTEWAVDPNSGHRGIIRPLLINLHSYLINRGINNIWADLRAPDPIRQSKNSIVPGLNSGMKIHTSPHHRFVLSNHVTIFGEPQSYNSENNRDFGDVKGNQLRSFVRGYVDARLFTRQLIDECLNSLTQ